MSKIIIKKITNALVPTPKVGKATIFIDTADNKVKVKHDDGGIRVLAYEDFVIGSGNDANYIQDFIGTDTVVIIHNLGKIPSVHIYDTSSGKEIQGEITYDLLDINNKLTIRFTTPKTGRVICN